MPAILFCLDCALLTPLGANSAQLIGEPIRLLETPRSLSEYVLITIIIIIIIIKRD